MRIHDRCLLLGGLSLLLPLALAAPSLAQVATEGPYAGVGGAVGFEDFDDLPPGVDPDAAGGFDVWGGYRVNEWFGAELQLEYLNGFDVHAFGSDFDSQLVNFHFNGKVFPLASVLPDRVQPFLKVGPGFTWFEVDGPGSASRDETDFSARMGGGLDFLVTDHVALQVSSSYILTTGDLDDARHVDLVFGAQYQF